MTSDWEIESILMDEGKQVEVDLRWRADGGRFDSYLFRAPVESHQKYLIEVLGRWNRPAGKLSYVLLLQGVGRIYGLDMGVGHRNPDGERVGSPHKYRWTAQHGDRQAYEPSDITAPWNEPVNVWRQFCAEARIVHLGRLSEPPRMGEDRL